MKKLLILALPILLLSSCGLARKKDPAPAPVNVKSELAQIEIDITSKAYNKALKPLAAITQQFADTDAADDAYILMGKVYAINKDYNRSYQAYISVIDSEFFSPREVDAALGAGQALLQLGRYD